MCSDLERQKGMCNYTKNLRATKAALQWCSRQKLFLKYAANLQENTHAKVMGFFLVNLLHIFRTPFFKNTSGWLILMPTCDTYIYHDCYIQKVSAVQETSQ